MLVAAAAFAAAVVSVLGYFWLARPMLSEMAYERKLYSVPAQSAHERLDDLKHAANHAIDERMRANPDTRFDIELVVTER